MKTPEEKAKDICVTIGRRMRAMRKAKRLTLDKLAERTGFAKSYLSQIENRKREPPFSTLTKIAYVLGVDLFFLIGGESRDREEDSITVTRASERKIIPRPSGSPAYVYEPINDKRIDRLMDGYIVAVGPEFPPDPLVHEGQELTYALEGKHEFFYEGKTYRFEEGDCYYFDSRKPHFARSLGRTPAKVLVVFASRK